MHLSFTCSDHSGITERPALGTGIATLLDPGRWNEFEEDEAPFSLVKGEMA
jgi:hypothetical protein